MTEQWRDIPGYEGLYQVSNTGYVMSLQGRKPHILRPSISTTQPQVVLYRNYLKHSFYVHQLVALAFLGECPDGYEVDHIDENPLNNHADNLRYLTRYENIHANTRKTRLTVEEVKTMIFAYNTSRLTMEEIGRPFGVDKQRVNAIISGKAWWHLHHLVARRRNRKEQAS